MSIVIRAFPIRSPEGLDELIAAMTGAKREEAEAFFRSYGLTHESWHLQDTPMGPWAIGLSVLDDAKEAAPRYAASTDAFDAWFKGQIMKVTGVNPDVEPLGPPTREIYRWSDSQRVDMSLT